MGNRYYSYDGKAEVPVEGDHPAIPYKVFLGGIVGVGILATVALIIAVTSAGKRYLK